MAFRLTPEQIRIMTEGTFEERVQLARRMTGEEKILATFHLTEIEEEKAHEKLRELHPNAHDEMILTLRKAEVRREREADYVDRPIIVRAGRSVVDN